MTTQPKWTWLLLRHYSMDYLGVKRLPRGLRAELRWFLRRPAYSSSLNAVLNRYLRRPWLP